MSSSIPTKPHECGEDYSFVREGYRCLFGNRCGRRPSSGVLGGGGSSSHSSYYYSYNASACPQQQEAVLACALMCIQCIIVQAVEAVFDFISDSSGVEMGSADSGTTQVESSESSTANIAVDETPVEILANGVANSDLVADVGDLDSTVEVDLPETSEGSDMSVASSDSVLFDQLVDSSEGNKSLGKPITVFVKQLVGNEYHKIEILANSPVAQLKDAIFHLEAVPSDKQRLMFRGKELEGDCTLSQASIVNESTIDLLLRGAVVGGGNTLGKGEEEDMDYEEQAYSSITLQPSVKLISDAALKNDLKDVCAIDIDEENELGGLPSADVNSEPYHPSPENALLHNQYAIPPNDLFTNPAYDSRLPQIEIWQEDAFTKMAAIPTIDDQKVHFVRMWLPYEASKAPNFKLWLGSLRYCPTTVQNFCGDGKGGFMSPMAAMFGNGKLRSASWGVIQLIFEHLYWMFAKMNTTPVVKAYKGTVYKLYTKKNYERLQKIYTNFVEKVFSVCDRIMFFSKGVLTELEEMFGTKKYDKIIDNLLRDEKVLSLAKDKVESIHHPEKLINIIYRDNSFEWLCKRYNAFGTLAKREMTGDMSLVCTVGTDIFNEVKDSEAYKLMIEACRQALLRAQKIVKQASAMDKSGDFGGMTDSHLGVLENWNLQRIASRRTIEGVMSGADMVVVQGIAKARGVGVEKVLTTVQLHQRFSASSRLASAVNCGKDVDFEAAANSLNTTKERLKKRVNKQIINQSAPKLASTIHREGPKSVDLAAQAKSFGLPEEELRQKVNKQIINQSAPKFASAINRGGQNSVDLTAKAISLGLPEEDLRKKVKTQQGNQNKIGTSCTLAAARRRGEGVDIAAHAKDLKTSNEDLEKRVNTQQGIQNKFTVARKFAARQQRGSEVFDVNNKEIQKASKDLGIPPSKLINNIESFVKGIKKKVKVSRDKHQLDLLEAGMKGKKTVHRASCNKCTKDGEEIIKFVSSTKPNVRCHGDCPSNCHRDWTVEERPLTPEECERIHTEMKQSTSTTNVVSSSGESSSTPGSKKKAAKKKKATAPKKSVDKKRARSDSEGLDELVNYQNDDAEIVDQPTKKVKYTITQGGEEALQLALDDIANSVCAETQQQSKKDRADRAQRRAAGCNSLVQEPQPPFV